MLIHFNQSADSICARRRRCQLFTAADPCAHEWIIHWQGGTVNSGPRERHSLRICRVGNSWQVRRVYQEQTKLTDKRWMLLWGNSPRIHGKRTTQMQLQRGHHPKNKYSNRFPELGTRQLPAALTAHLASSQTWRYTPELHNMRARWH